MPVFVQLALGTALTAIGALLLSRRSVHHDISAPDVRAAQTAAEAVLLMALIFTMIAGIVRGMGMPTTPAYIIMTALLVFEAYAAGPTDEASREAFDRTVETLVFEV